MVEREPRRSRPPPALWLPHLTSTKEEYLPMLRQLDEAGLVRQGPHSRGVILLTVDLVGVID